MANELAVTLDREGIAEMSCIAGVGGDVGPLVQTATSGRDIVAIDGCPLQCTRQSLDQHDVTPTEHYDLSQRGVAKEYHTDYDDETAETVLDELVEESDQLERA
jgi:uncharacterized metal-binding protein